MDQRALLNLKRLGHLRNVLERSLPLCFVYKPDYPEQKVVICLGSYWNLESNREETESRMTMFGFG